jgi:hypothetical protein
MAAEPSSDSKRPQRDRVNAVRPMMGIAVGIVPFVTSYRTTRDSSVTVGESGTEIRTVIKRTSFDRVAVPCGGVALALGVVGLVRAVSVRNKLVGLVSVVAIVLGLLQIARGIAP